MRIVFIGVLIVFSLFTTCCRADILSSNHYSLQCSNAFSHGEPPVSYNYALLYEIKNLTDKFCYKPNSYKQTFWLLGDLFVNSDSDRMPDWWELYFNTDIYQNNENEDSDNDTLTDISEYLLSTNPGSSDSDFDSIPDLWEYLNLTNPVFNDASADYDNDGLDNLGEYLNNTNPLCVDTDGDGLSDGDEVSGGSNPNVAGQTIELSRQSAHYGISGEHSFSSVTNLSIHSDNISSVTSPQSNYESNHFELKFWIGTPLFVNSDTDRMPDWWELFYGTNPLVDDGSMDADNDGVPNVTEFIIGSNPNSIDSDSDLMPDYWEFLNGTNPIFFDAILDYDNDGLNNLPEYMYNTDPFNADTDGDGESDYDEIVAAGNPLVADETYDVYRESAHFSILSESISNIELSYSISNDNISQDSSMHMSQNTESSHFQLNLWLDDLFENSDTDRMPDWWELFYSTNHLINDGSQDPDNDTLSNETEYLLSINPNSTDSDNDLMTDIWEVSYGTNPALFDSILDYDNDGLNNLTEFIYQIDPLSADTDGDGEFDYYELLHGNNPNLADNTFDVYRETSRYALISESFSGALMFSMSHHFDNIAENQSIIVNNQTLSSKYEFKPWFFNALFLNSDTDIMPDWWELFYSANHLINDGIIDSDNDSLSYELEYKLGSNPNSGDTDNDLLIDLWEFLNQTNINLHDSALDYDNDGLTNLDESLNGTDPLNPDTDGDGVSDYDEVLSLTDPLSADYNFGLVRESDHYLIIPETVSALTDNFVKSNHFDSFSVSYKYDFSVYTASNDYSFYPWYKDTVNINTDTDRMPDWWELLYSTNIYQNNEDEDTDNDGLTALTEYIINTSPNSSDTDNDGIPDLWEFSNGTDPATNDADLDYDNDGLTNIQEFSEGTDPLNSDCDGDGIPDGQEINDNTDPNQANSNFDIVRQSSHYSINIETSNSFGSLSYSNFYDSLYSAMIIHVSGWLESVKTHVELGVLWILSNDIDGDKIPDVWEAASGTNPFVFDSDADPDGDGLTNIIEYEIGTKPLLKDTDGDGQDDYFENEAGTDPTDADSMFICIITFNPVSGITLSWHARADKYYKIMVKDSLEDDFKLHTQNIQPVSTGLYNFTDNGVDNNTDGDFMDENDILPPADENIKQRFYKIVIE